MAQDKAAKDDKIARDPPKLAIPPLPDADRAGSERRPPPLPLSPPQASARAEPPEGSTAPAAGASPDWMAQPVPPPTPPRVRPPGPSESAHSVEKAPARRTARRRPAGPVRNAIPANDDVPSIGGLIYALNQKPANTPFRYAAIATAVWAALTLIFGWLIVSGKMAEGAGLGAILADPTTFLVVAAIVVPVAVVWFLAVLAWRTEELKLRSSTMTEVAIRLAEPDRMAEQSVASLGQAVRRQVSFMNDAVSRALGRAGELEALVHNEVAALERSYEENERRIRGLIQELSGERSELLGTSERVAETLRSLGNEVPQLIERLSAQQIKLATIIQSAGENLTALESAVGQSTNRLETTLSDRTEQLTHVLETYTGAIGQAIGSRTDEFQNVLEGYTIALADALSTRSQNIQTAFAENLATLNSSLEGRTSHLQSVFEEYAHALDSALANRAQILDGQLVERTRALDAAFNERLRLFDESIQRSTIAIDSAVGERALALTSALDNHAKVFSETIQRQTAELDQQLIQGISAVRRTSENITRQSLKAIEGLAGQSEMLRNVSENLLGQINSVTNRFENQGQTIMRAANALETVNYKIDTTLQNRHAALSQTLDALSSKAEEFGRFALGYSSTIEGTLSEAELKARAAAEELRLGAETTKRAALADIERLKAETDIESARRLEELRARFANVSAAVSKEIDSLSSRADATAEEVRRRTARTAAEITAEQARLKEQIDTLPVATRESAEAMRRALADQLKALDQISALSQRTALARDVVPPAGVSLAPPAPPHLGAGAPVPVAPPRPAQPPAQRMPGTPDSGRESWSLGDLLARASREETQSQAQALGPSVAQTPVQSQPGAARPTFQLDVDAIARALDAATTAALWSRITAGHRGVLARGLYTTEGRAVFDELVRRLPTDPELRSTIGRFLDDFEHIRRDLDERDPSGRLTNGHLNSDSGRVYLFLAHATGRMS